MNYQRLIIYDYIVLFNILHELKNEINFEILKISKNDLSNTLLKNNENNLIVTKTKIAAIGDQIIVNNLPIKIVKLVEKFNTEFLKKKFNHQSEIYIGNYKMNLNSRELTFNKKKIRLTEKETGIILYLSKSKKPVSID